MGDKKEKSALTQSTRARTKSKGVLFVPQLFVFVPPSFSSSRSQRRFVPVLAWESTRTRVGNIHIENMEDINNVQDMLRMFKKYKK